MCFGHPHCDNSTGAAHACGHHAQMASLYGAACGIVKSGAERLKISCITADCQDATVYNDWYKAVYMPTVTETDESEAEV